MSAAAVNSEIQRHPESAKPSLASILEAKAGRIFARVGIADFYRQHRRDSESIRRMLYSAIVSAIREMIGQMLMTGVKGLELSGEERSLFKEFGVGGFILFKHNLVEAEQIVALCRSLWNLAEEQPPFISIDQEGGRVHRLPPPFTHFPAAASIGAVEQPALAYRIARATAAELAMLGINLNFAPVLDVNSHPLNPTIGDRSFGPDPRQVARLGEQTIAGLRSGGIIPCGKHFPGHGGTQEDSHDALPVVDCPLADLETREFRPFAQACRGGIEALMTAHVLYPALDSDWPATVSRRIISGRLREQLNYDGVVFSDDLEMKAIDDHYPREQAVELCAGAGVDVLVYGHHAERAADAGEFLLRRSAEHGRIRARAEASFHRIVRLKRRFLKAFTGMKSAAIADRLRHLNHGGLAAAVQGNLYSA